MIRKTVLLFLILPLASAAFTETLDVGTELTISPPWTQPIALEALPEGRYRLEATNLANDPVEVVVDKKDQGDSWVASGTNRTLRGSLDGYVDLAVRPGETWQVRPAQTERGTAILRLRKAAFAELKETLKQNLTTSPAVTLPLKKRLELAASGGPGLAAAVGAGGTLWIGWLTDGGWGAEVWDATKGQRVGPVLQADSGPWTGLALGGTEVPVATLSNAKGRHWRFSSRS